MAPRTQYAACSVKVLEIPFPQPVPGCGVWAGLVAMHLNCLTTLSPAVPMAVATTTTPTRLFVAVTELCQWTSMCQVRSAALPCHTRHRLQAAGPAWVGDLDVSCVLQSREPDGPCLAFVPLSPRVCSPSSAALHGPQLSCAAGSFRGSVCLTCVVPAL